ncbi:MAG TPA: DUF1499 domain-containing protein [Burkholderiales bacterium]|nr:DUF1499 domain-containing protein [Burkholderiales bacterium]
MWLRFLALALGVVAVAALVASGPGTRLGLWDWRAGLGLLRYAAYLGIAACAASLAGLLLPRVRRKSLAISLLLGFAALAPPLFLLQQASSFPPINDIATDSESAAQRRAYPDIQPILSAQPRDRAFQQALVAAEAVGWEIVTLEPQAGRIEAVDTTAWFGFKDDVVVRVAEVPGGSRIDVRSKSRVGRGDAGTNAKRIREFRAKLAK